MKQVLGGDCDELDGPSFDVVSFINKKFPNDQSLTTLDRAIAEYDAEIQALDAGILEKVGEQSTAGSLAARDISDATQSIEVLKQKIEVIRLKAVACEDLVKEICKDIRGLDTAKTHLELSIQALGRLRNLVNAVESLQRMLKRPPGQSPDYGAVAPFFKDAVALLGSFGLYVKRVKRLEDIQRAIEAARADLEENISHDFHFFIGAVTPTSLGGQWRGDQLKENQLHTLEGIYECMDALGSSLRRTILQRFCMNQLAPYYDMFSTRKASSPEALSLECVESRYEWFRASMSAIDQRFDGTLPKRWRVQHRLAIEFGNATRTDIEAILNECTSTTAPPQPLLTALLKTVKWEQEMTRRFEGPDLQKALVFELKGGEGSGSGSGGDFGGLVDGVEEEYDDSAPLFDKDGRQVDPSTGEGIKLKHARRSAWEKRQAANKKRLAELAEQRANLAALGGYVKTSGGKIALGEEGLVLELQQLVGGNKFLGEGKQGLVSRAFKPYLPSYVLFERAKINSVVYSSTAMDMKKSGKAAVGADGAAAATSSILSSAGDLFTEFRNAVGRCKQLNTGDILFSLYDNIRMAVEDYTRCLREQLPVPVTKETVGSQVIPGLVHQLGGDTYNIPAAESLRSVDACCLVITTSGSLRVLQTLFVFSPPPPRTQQTPLAAFLPPAPPLPLPFNAEVCADMAVRFADTFLKQTIDAEYRDSINSSTLQDYFFALSAHSSTTLASLACSLCDPHFSSMIAVKWKDVREFGDEGQHVKEIRRLLQQAFTVIRRRLDATPFRALCDKFVKAFTARYLTTFYRLDKVSEQGANWLLLEAKAIEKILLQVPLSAPATDVQLAQLAASGILPPAEEGGDRPLEEEDSVAATLPKAYVSHINKEMGRVTTMLKILAAPKDSFAATFRQLWPAGGSIEAPVNKLLSMKEGLEAKDKNEIMLALGLNPKAEQKGATPSFMGLSFVTTPSAASLQSGKPAAAAGGGAAPAAGPTMSGMGFQGMKSMMLGLGGGKK
jgi:hypothetical protein